MGRTGGSLPPCPRGMNNQLLRNGPPETESSTSGTRTRAATNNLWRGNSFQRAEPPCTGL